jgi:hypothetical protein
MAFDQEPATRLREVLLAEDCVTEKPMVGGLAFDRGQPGGECQKSGWAVLRVEPWRTDNLASYRHAHPMGGGQMDGWLRVDAAGVHTRPLLE